MNITTKKTTTFSLNAKETKTLRVILDGYSEAFLTEVPVHAMFAKRLAEEIDKSQEEE